MAAHARVICRAADLVDGGAGVRFTVRRQGVDEQLATCIADLLESSITQRLQMPSFRRFGCRDYSFLKFFNPEMSWYAY